MREEKQVFGGLNGLRGVAAIAVMLFHAKDLFGVAVAPAGYMAVDLFFMLSGFVIAHAYDERIAGGLGAARFAWIRLRRFYPLYLTGLVLAGAWMSLERWHGAPTTLTAGAMTWALLWGLLFLPTPGGRDLYPLNPPSWSLLIELAVNWLFVLCHRSLSSAVLAVVVGASLAALLLQGLPANGGALFTDWHIGLLRALYGFPLGVLLYRHRAAIAAKVSPWPVLAVAAGCLVVSGLDALKLALIFPAIVTLLATAADRPLFRGLGAISFPLYAIHYPLLLIAPAVGTRVGLEAPTLGVAYALAAIVAAAVLARFLEPRDASRAAEPPSNPYAPTR